jgi:hypothetical protein
MLPRVYINRKLARFGKGAYLELCRTLELGLSVIEVDDDVSELADDGVCYIGFFPTKRPSLMAGHYRLSGQDLKAMTSLILNFCWVTSRRKLQRLRVKRRKS